MSLESFPTPAPIEQEPHLDENADQLIARLHSDEFAPRHIKELAQKNHEQASHEVAAVESEAHKELSHVPLFTEYLAGAIPTIDSVSAGIERALTLIDSTITEARASGISEEDLREDLQLYNQLGARSREIKLAVRNYIRTVIQFHIAKERMIASPNDEDARERLGNIDKYRTVAHNGLIESLRVLGKNLKESADNSLLSGAKLVSWKPGITLSPNHTEAPIVYFDDSVLANRGYVRDWALVVDCMEELRKIKKLVEETESV